MIAQSVESKVDERTKEVHNSGGAQSELLILRIRANYHLWVVSINLIEIVIELSERDKSGSLWVPYEWLV